MREKKHFTKIPGIVPLLIMLFLLSGCPVSDPPGDNPAVGSGFSLTVSIAGAGSVTVSPEKIEYTDGESISLTAVPDSGNSFLKWSGDLSGYGETAKSFTITGDMSITAEFASGSTYYVESGGTGNGSFSDPGGSIQTVIDTATAPASIFISAGTYNESVSMKEGISLFGGFSAGFMDREFETESDRTNTSYKTLIANPSSTGEGAVDDPVAAVGFDGTTTAITNSTVMEGLTVQSGVGNYDTAVRCMADASPVIRYNTITGTGDGSNTSGSYGIFSRNSSPLITRNIITGSTTASALAHAVNCAQVTGELEISNNTIYGGDDISGADGAIGIVLSDSAAAEPVIENNIITGGINASNQALGIYDLNSASIIRNNIVSAGSAAGSTTGINCYESTVYNNLVHGGTSAGAVGIGTATGSPYITNNTICGGSGTSTTHAIYTYMAGASIVNNILFCKNTAGTGNGIYSVSAYPVIFNNDIFDCDVLFHFYDGAAHIDYTTTSGYETALTSSNASGNVSVDLIDDGGTDYLKDPYGPDADYSTITDNNWQLAAATSDDVRGGGRVPAATFTTDFDGSSRTAAPPLGTNDNAAGWSMGAYELD